MKILIDTNILISAALNPSGVPYRAYEKAVSFPNKGIICETNVEELRRIFNRKFPDKMKALDSFLSVALLSMEIVPTPEEETAPEEYIRDQKDRPILRAAIAANVDLLLTGDKDFLESGITTPRIITATEFLALND